ncbi:MAG: S49 family peptidase [Alphaproteobacteria bacterium]
MEDVSSPVTHRHWWQRKPQVTAVRLEGVIGAGSFSGALNLRTLARPLEAAFKRRHAAEVALVVNSPGGAPVQAARLHDHIRFLASKHRKHVTAYVEDVAASGGYWVALAADDIVAHPSSIVGSIGVITASFGFHRALERLGVERRLYATGDHKGMLDPFRPENEADVHILKELHADTFDDFVALVRARRGDRLAADEGLFDGRVVSGHRARAVGLVDEVGDPMDVLRRRHGDDVRVRLYGPPRKPWWRRLRGEGPDAVLARLEQRLMWQRFGL